MDNRSLNNPQIAPYFRRLLTLSVISAGLFSINRLVLIPSFPDVHFLKQYLADFLALPAYLPLSLYLAWRLNLIPETFRLRFSHILGASLIFGLLFEGVIPMVDETAIRDPMDVLAYLLGGVLVYIVAVTGMKSLVHNTDQVD